MPGTIAVVVGGQFGSEGKGAVAAHLARGRENLIAVRVAGPNAGHSAVDDNGVKWALRQIPVMAVTNHLAKLVIGQGSEIDMEVLEHEIEALDGAGFRVSERLYVDEGATLIEQKHKDEEAGGLVGAIGSTGKGIGAARASRAMRDAELFGKRLGGGPPWRFGCDTAGMLHSQLDRGATVIIEGTQGYGLGQHAGYYPKCTSSDCRAVDFMAMAGVSPWAPYVKNVRVWVVLRTFPIRVAGDSGPMLAETTWEDLGAATDGYIKPERTTVTKKVRRVGCWDPDLARAAVEANGGTSTLAALTFFDYWYPELAGATEPDQLAGLHRTRVREIEEQIGTHVAYLGTGPASGIWL